MNQTAVDAKWKQLRAEARTGPGQLAGSPRRVAAGKFDQLIGSLQERFGYSRERAERELRRRVAKHEMHGPQR